MTRFADDELPDELRDVAERLRAARPSLTQRELDQLKLRAMANAAEDEAPSAGRSRRIPTRSRVLALALAALVIGGTTAGGIAAGGTSTSGNAAASQYCKKSEPPHPPPCSK